VDEACRHCGLPLRGRAVRARIGGEPGCFCCVGCVLAMQVTRARGDGGAAASLMVRLGMAVFFAMNVMMTSMASYVPQVYDDRHGPLDGPLFIVLRVLSAVFALPVLAILGGPIVASAWSRLRAARASSDLLVMIAVLAAYGLSIANTIAGRSAVYFDTAVMLLIFVTAGRYLEARARAAAAHAVRAVLVPGGGRSRRFDGDRLEDVALAELRPGDEIEVSPGEAFPTDGIVLCGESAVDESALTGESRPVVKHPGSAVSGGTCSIDGRLRVRVGTVAGESAYARIEAMIGAARRERSAAERLADRVAALLVPLVVALALAAGLWWTRHDGVDRGILVAVAVLVVACPCALGIATPVAIAAGLAGAAERGVVVRSAPVLERAAQATRVVFDKTGTLTEPVPTLERIELAPGVDPAEERTLLAKVAALEHGLAHPLARACVAAAGARDVTPLVARDVRVVAGRGVSGVVNEERLFVGVPATDAATGAAFDTTRPDATIAEVRSDHRLVARLTFRERARPGAREAIDALRALRLQIAVLSGDRGVRAIVPDVVEAAEVTTGLSPEGKLVALRRMRTVAAAEQGAILMVGDGINDAPALAAADVGVAVASATELARVTADVVVLRETLDLVPWLIVHARRVRRTARQNLAWAFTYNAVAVVVAASGALNPLIASLAMLGSSLAVVANARRLAVGRRQPASAVRDDGSLQPSARLAATS
jgi:Cu2+-exporting ATPase